MLPVKALTLEAYELTSAGNVFETWYDGTWHTNEFTGTTMSGL